MKEFLKNLSLNEETIEKILNKHNQTVQKEKQEVETLKQTLNQKESELKNVSDNLKKIEKLEPEKIQSELANAREEMKILREQHKKELTDIKLNNAIDLALINSGAINNKAVMPFINRENIILNDEGAISGLANQIEELQKSEDTKFLFKQEKQTVLPQGLNIQTGGIPAQSIGMPTGSLDINKPFDINNLPDYDAFVSQYENK